MAHLDSVPSKLLGGLALEIGDFVSKTLGDTSEGMVFADKAESDSQGAALRLGETLTVWKLKDDAFSALSQSTISGDLVDWVEKTSFLYHQIKLNAEPQGFARSSLTDSDSTIRLSQINASPIAWRINQLFKVIERNEHEGLTDPVVRLLEIPPYHVSALWLFEESQRESRLVIINAPIRQGTLKPDAFLTSQEFFNALSNARPIVGVARKSGAG